MSNAVLPYWGSYALVVSMVEQSTDSDRRVFHTLDALRGIAAIGVVTFHMKQAFAPVAAHGGYLAVDLFFMMSGVVLSHAYEARFAAGMGVFAFMRARFIRLYPLYFLATLFGVGVTLASMFGRNSQHWDWFSLAQAAVLAGLFLPNLSDRAGNQMFPLNIPCWSLFLEVVVNLLFVLSWPLLSSRRLIVLCLLGGGVVGWAAIQGGNIDQGSAYTDFAVGLARTIFGFAVGVLIARHIRRVDREQSNFKVVAIVAVIGLAIFGSPSGGWRVVWDVGCVLMVFPLMVYWAARVDPGPGLRNMATFLGVTSYAVYVFHSPLSAIINSAARYFAGDVGVSAGAPYLGLGVLALLLAGCWLIDRYVDMPIRRYLSKAIPASRLRS